MAFKPYNVRMLEKIRHMNANVSMQKPADVPPKPTAVNHTAGIGVFQRTHHHMNIISQNVIVDSDSDDDHKPHTTPIESNPLSIFYPPHSSREAYLKQRERYRLALARRQTTPSPTYEPIKRERSPFSITRPFRRERTPLFVHTNVARELLEARTTIKRERSQSVALESIEWADSPSPEQSVSSNSSSTVTLRKSSRIRRAPRYLGFDQERKQRRMILKLNFIRGTITSRCE